MFIGVIYRVTSPSNKKYYGQTTSKFEARKKSHYKDAFIRQLQGSFQRSLRKYGWDNFKWDIIETYENDDKIELVKILNDRELFWIKKDLTYLPEFGYNMKIGPSYGFHNDECKDKIRQTLLGVEHTEERKHNQSLSQIGLPHAQNFGPPRYGKDNSSYKIVSKEDRDLILDLYNKGFGSRRIETALDNKYSFIKILKIIKAAGVYKPHKFDGNINRAKTVK
jgi:group I intron endonuclease